MVNNKTQITLYLLLSIHLETPTNPNIRHHVLCKMAAILRHCLKTDAAHPWHTTETRECEVWTEARSALLTVIIQLYGLLRSYA